MEDSSVMEEDVGEFKAVASFWSRSGSREMLNEMIYANEMIYDEEEDTPPYLKTEVVSARIHLNKGHRQSKVIIKIPKSAIHSLC